MTLRAMCHITGSPGPRDALQDFFSEMKGKKQTPVQQVVSRHPRTFYLRPEISWICSWKIDTEHMAPQVTTHLQHLYTSIRNNQCGIFLAREYLIAGSRQRHLRSNDGEIITHVRVWWRCITFVSARYPTLMCDMKNGRVTNFSFEIRWNLHLGNSPDTKNKVSPAFTNEQLTTWIKMLVWARFTGLA